MTNLMIDDATLAKLEATAKEATPGPWYFKHNPSDCTYTIRDHIATWVGDTLPESTATLIVESRNALPDLLATIRALIAALGRIAQMVSPNYVPLKKGESLLDMWGESEGHTTEEIYNLGVDAGRQEAAKIARATLRGEGGSDEAK